MPADEKMMVLRNYDLWCEMSDEEYEALNRLYLFRLPPS